MKRRHFDPLDCARGRLRARRIPRLRSGQAARSGKIYSPTQAVWEGPWDIAEDSSTSLRSARNDGAIEVGGAGRFPACRKT